MSYRSRERRRRMKIAKTRAREKHGETMKRRHYLTIVKRKCCCNKIGCGRMLKEGDECVFRKEPMEILCVICANRMKIKFRTSQSWETRRRKEQRARKR